LTPGSEALRLLQGSSFHIYGVACLQTAVASFDVVNVPLVHSNVQTVKTAWSEEKKFSAGNHAAFFHHQNKEKITKKGLMVKANYSDFGIFL
jgi:hypothetical protein